VTGTTAAPAGEPAPPSHDPADDPPSEPKSPWDDARLPWKGSPSRSDILCWVGFSLTGLYGLAMLPLRPVLLGANPVLLGFLTGSNSAMVTIGALAATGVGSWPFPLLLGAIGIMKFDLIFWWAGRLWGRGLLEVMSGRSARAARAAARAERLAQRFGVIAILVTYLPIPLPGPIVYATVGAAGMRLRTFLLVDFLGALVSRAGYIWLGYALGQRAVDVVEVIARYSLWLSLLLVAGILIAAFRRRGAGQNAAPA
jgi:membrane protein DedA with SNARE-associated domain